MTNTTLLIDADVLVWRASSVAQETFAFGNVNCITADLGRAIDKFDMDVLELRRRLRANAMLMALSDPKQNWRKTVLPTYKSHRSQPKPRVFWQLREHVENTYRAEWHPTLEGDDVMGLYSTGKTIAGKRIIVSVDKDMRQIPGWLYNPNQPGKGAVLIRQEEADRWHLMQTLMGDPQDGYFGIPGIGPKKAAAILDHATSSGVPLWEAVCAAYLKAGLTADDALQQARVARILRCGEYDRPTGKVTLWTPSEVTTSQTSASPSKTPGPAKSSRRARGGTSGPARDAST